MVISLPVTLLSPSHSLVPQSRAPSLLVQCKINALTFSLPSLILLSLPLFSTYILDQGARRY